MTPKRPKLCGAALLVALVVLATIWLAIRPAWAEGPGAPSSARSGAPRAGVTAEDVFERDGGRIEGPLDRPAGSRPISGTRPISGSVPYPWPYALPWWCTLPTPVAPPPLPGAPTPVPPTPVPSPTPGGRATSATYSVCRRLQGRVPASVLAEALAEPWTLHGYGLCRNRNVPYHPLWNPLRTELNLLNPNVPYGICNPVVWKAGCM